MTQLEKAFKTRSRYLYQRAKYAGTPVKYATRLTELKELAEEGKKTGMLSDETLAQIDGAIEKLSNVQATMTELAAKKKATTDETDDDD